MPCTAHERPHGTAELVVVGWTLDASLSPRTNLDCGLVIPVRGATSLRCGHACSFRVVPEHLRVAIPSRF